MSDSHEENAPRRKRRTREHVLEDLSQNHLERLVLLKGHVLRRPERDYGVDVTMFHFADDGTIENGEVRFQLKATDSLRVTLNGAEISLSIKTGDLHLWGSEIYPFILVVFDASTEVAFWLHIQDYVRQHPDCVDPSRKTNTIRIPVSNKLSLESIEYFRARSLQVIESLSGWKGISDATRKPK
ncbi:MAG: DUF4365 domain-containing protein [Pirellulaceae bacterium]